jgi:hypothetical protein
MKSSVFWDMTPCSPLKVDLTTYSLLNVPSVSGTTMQQDAEI